VVLCISLRLFRYFLGARGGGEGVSLSPAVIVACAGAQDLLLNGQGDDDQDLRRWLPGAGVSPVVNFP